MKKGKVIKQLGGFLWKRHWTTKLVWGFGLGLMLLNIFMILFLYPLELRLEGYDIVYGKAIQQGILNTCSGGMRNTFQSCISDTDCISFGENTVCDSTCMICNNDVIPRKNSFLFKSWTGGEYPVVGDLELGWAGKIALDGREVVGKGVGLWDYQQELFGALTMPGMVDALAYPGYGDRSFAGVWFVFLFYFLVVSGILVYDNIPVRLLTGFFCGYFLSANAFANFIFYFPALLIGGIVMVSAIILPIYNWQVKKKGG